MPTHFDTLSTIRSTNDGELGRSSLENRGLTELKKKRERARRVYDILLNNPGAPSERINDALETWTGAYNAVLFRGEVRPIKCVAWPS